MGLFSSKTVVTVSTHISRVIQDAAIPDSLKTGTINSIFTGEGQLVEHVMDSALAGIGQKAERMYQFGKREYIYGLPTSAALNSRPPEAVVKDIIQQSEGRPVLLAYYHYGVLNYLHYGWQTLINLYQYDPRTNELAGLSLEKDSPVYLQDFQVVLSKATADIMKPDALAQWGNAATAGYSVIRPTQNGSVARPQTPFGVDLQAGNDYYKVTVNWIDPATRSRLTQVLQVDMPLSSEEDYYQVKYVYDDVVKYFTYQAGSGTYPVLDNLYSPEYDDLGSFFPFGYFRYNKQAAYGNPASAEYINSKKLMNYLGLDYRQVAEAIEANPGIADVDSALLMMAVPASTSNPLEQRYLFDFFKALHMQTATVDAPISAINSYVANAVYGNLPGMAITIMVQDARFKAALNMKGIYRKIKYGTIGKVGSYASGSMAMPAPDPGVNVADNYSYVIGDIEAPLPAYYYRKQLTETLYEEYLVDGLEMSYLVTDKVAKAQSVLVPLDHSLTRDYSALMREQLYARSLHYVINSRHEQKLKWYQQQWFQVVLIIVAIVMTVITWGSDGGALAGLLLGGTISALEYIVINLIILPYLVKAVMQMFVKMLGPEFAILAALVMTVWAGVSAFNAGSIQGAPMAQDLLQLSSGLINQVQAHFTEALQGIAEQASEFNSLTQQKQGELETANKLLENNHLLNPFVVFGESPDDYFNRTVHSGNIGVAGIDAISSYVKISLQLPELQDTLSFDEPAWG